MSLLACMLLLVGLAYAESEHPLTLDVRSKDATKPGYETIQAMGRSFSLGYLYDIRSETIISKSLWDKADLDANIHDESALSTRFEVAISDTINDKSSLMDLSASIKASFMGGLIQVSGSAKFMNSKKSNSRVTSVTLKSERKSRTKRLSMDHLAHVKYPDVLAEEQATHVIAGITYGANAYFRFEKTLKDTDDKQEISGALGIDVRSIPNFAVQGNGSIELTEEDKQFVDDLRVEFFGDYDVTPPTSYEAAVKTVQELYNRDQVQDIPITISLVPLHTLSNNADVMVRKLGERAVEDMSQIMMYLDEAVEELDSLLLYKVSQAFPAYAKFINNVKSQFEQKALAVRGVLTTLLPRIRSAEASDSELVKVIKEFEASNFAGNVFRPWLNQQKEELTLFNIISKTLKSDKNQDGKVYEEHTYETVLGHALRAGREGTYVLNVCLVSSANPGMLTMLEDAGVSQFSTAVRYPTNQDYWAGMEQMNFQGQFFELLSSLKEFSKKNVDKKKMRFVVYTQYMCKANSASVDYMQFARKKFSNVDLAIEFQWRLNLDKRVAEFNVVRNINSEHDVHVEIKFKHVQEKDYSTFMDAFPKDLPAGKYLAEARVVAPGGAHLDYIPLEEPLEVKECKSDKAICDDCGWNGNCQACKAGELRNGKCLCEDTLPNCSVFKQMCGFQAEIKAKCCKTCNS